MENGEAVNNSTKDTQYPLDINNKYSNTKKMATWYGFLVIDKNTENILQCCPHLSLVLW